MIDRVVTHRRRISVALTALLAIMGACLTQEGSESFVVDHTASGVPVVNNRPGTAPPIAPMVARVALELGSLDGEAPDVFGDIGAIDITGDEIFVLDALAREIRVFGLDGRHLRSFGRAGDGPGEFQYADAIVATEEGSVWVFDPPRLRLSLFGPTGEYQSSVTGQPGPISFPSPSVIAPDGDLFGVNFRNIGRDYSSPMHAGDLDLYQIIRVDPETGSVDTLPSITMPVSRVGDVRVPQAGVIQLAIEPDGSVWFSHPTEYRLYHRSPSGDTLLIVELEGQVPVPISAAERDSIAAGLRRTATRFGRDGPIPAADDIPEARPLVARVLGVQEGILFVVPRVEGVTEGTVVDLFDAEVGEYRGQVELPFSLGRSDPVRLRGRTLIAAVPGELDVPKVVRVVFDER